MNVKPNMTVNGESVAGGSFFPIENPATEEVIAEAPCCDAQILESAVSAAVETFQKWAERRDRAELLLECARRLKRDAPRLARLLTAEQGKPLRESINEIMGAARALRHVAQMETPPESEPMTSGSNALQIRRCPLGVIAAIVPWNFPVILAIWKIAPALRAGNTVVLKPSPFTPLTTLELGALFRDILPPGVLNIISGDEKLGAALTRHPAIRKVMFTGSVKTGKTVARSAADDLKRVVLELGGNDAAIVLPDAAPNRIAENLFWGAFRNCGQVCLAIKRLYVHDAVYLQVIEELKRIAESVVVGNGLESKTQLGPLNNRAQRERVASMVDDARQASAQVITGGTRGQEPGYFFNPTIVTDISEGASLVDDEQFGPVLPVMRYIDVEDAIARANATNFGLGGSIWSSDPGKAGEVATQLQCGTVWINQHGYTDPGVPIGGQKWSGIGYENGAAGFAECYQLQTVFGMP